MNCVFCGAELSPVQIPTPEELRTRWKEMDERAGLTLRVYNSTSAKVFSVEFDDDHVTVTCGCPRCEAKRARQKLERLEEMAEFIRQDDGG